MAKLERPKKGESVGTLWTYVDPAIAVLNAILSCEVKIIELKPDEKPVGQFKQSDANMMLYLKLPKGGSGIPKPPASGTFVLGSVDGKVQWIDTTDCSV